MQMFKNGNKAGRGRPKGFRGVAKMIMKETGDGRELVEFALKVFRDEDEYHHNRWEALCWLADRGLGRPMQMVDLQAALEVNVDHRAVLVDGLKMLDGADRARFRELLLKASGDTRTSAQKMLDARPAGDAQEAQEGGDE